MTPSDDTKLRPDQGAYVISVMAEILGVHPQTLRGYERHGLLKPTRSRGGTRLYSPADVARAQRVIELSNEGLTHTGISRILALEDKLAKLKRPSVALVPFNQDPSSPPPARYRRSRDRSKGVF